MLEEQRLDSYSQLLLVKQRLMCNEEPLCVGTDIICLSIYIQLCYVASFK